MSYYLAEDFRNLVNKLNEYLITTNEEKESDENKVVNNDKPTDDLDTDAEDQTEIDNDTEEPNDKDLDDLLTTSSIDKITGTVNIPKLTKLVKFDDKEGKLFKNAVIAWQSDPGHTTPSQNEILARAFIHTLKLSPEEHRQLTTVTTGIHKNGMSEAAEDTADTASITDIESLMKSVAKVSPTARLQVTKLANHLLDGIKDKHKDGGIDHVMNYIVQSISAAQKGDKGAALDTVSKMVSHVEGDNHAVDSSTFPHIVIDLLLIISELDNQV